jgi:hypothetical protein
MNSCIELNLTRQFFFEKDGKTFPAELRINRVEKLHERKWICYWSCDYVCDEGRIWGEDALHAIMNCIKLIRELLEGCERTGMQYWWKYRGDKCYLHELGLENAEMNGPERMT